MRPIEQGGGAATPLRLLVLSPLVDGTDVSEPFFAFKWIEALARLHDVTLLTNQRAGRVPTAEQLPGVRVVSWPEPAFLGRVERIRAKVKPGWTILAWRASRWLKAELAAGRRFDVAHQLYPAAMRHSSPLRRFDIPYVMGPVAGMLSTPPAFRGEVSEGLLGHLRGLDALRLRVDPVLRASFERAAAVIGVGPYVREILGPLRIKRFETMLEGATDSPCERQTRVREPGELRLLHVGRAIRTKGLRDVVRAMAALRDLPGVTLTSAGEGEDLETCKREAAALGVADRIRFLGRISRAEVEQLYASHDVFVFPSFREPMGSVYFEAMRWGLPIIAARRGGPEAIFGGGGARLIEVTSPDIYAQDIAAAIRALAADPQLLEAFGKASAERYTELGDWSTKAEQITALYRAVIEERARA